MIVIFLYTNIAMSAASRFIFQR